VEYGCDSPQDVGDEGSMGSQELRGVVCFHEVHAGNLALARSAEELSGDLAISKT
jgi:hypothetical protein